jgi:hypothetical protein
MQAAAAAAAEGLPLISLMFSQSMQKVFTNVFI